MLALLVDDAERADGGAHPAQLLVLRRAVVDAPVREVDRRDQVDEGAPAGGAAEDLDRVGRGDLAGEVAAHAVGHDDEVVGDEDAVSLADWT